ncbi:unnamed protein product [Paramecium primaurelia]|uniref:Uncharacterized protein n=1 Tax=Paramecium primaurelia TaxID=5886 RepID=A0A8S1QPL0_PARPR|nr:unnamed protein product [Paramecium primaurelia]
MEQLIKRIANLEIQHIIIDLVLYAKLSKKKTSQIKNSNLNQTKGLLIIIT